MYKFSLWSKDKLGRAGVKLDRGRRKALAISICLVISVAGQGTLAYVKLFLELDPIKVASIHWKNKDYFVRISVLQRLLLTA